MPLPFLSVIDLPGKDQVKTRREGVPSHWTAVETNHRLPPGTGNDIMVAGKIMFVINQAPHPHLPAQYSTGLQSPNLEGVIPCYQFLPYLPLRRCQARFHWRKTHLALGRIGRMPSFPPSPAPTLHDECRESLEQHCW